MIFIYFNYKNDNFIFYNNINAKTGKFICQLFYILKKLRIFKSNFVIIYDAKIVK